MNNVNLESHIQDSPIEAGINSGILSVVGNATRGFEFLLRAKCEAEGRRSGEFLSNDFIHKCRCGDLDNLLRTGWPWRVGDPVAHVHRPTAGGLELGEVEVGRDNQVQGLEFAPGQRVRSSSWSDPCEAWLRWREKR